MQAMPKQPRFARKSLALAAAVALALAAGFAPQAHAQSGAAAAANTPADRPVALNIAAQPLAQALNELARQANLQMTFPAALVAGKRAPAVSGQMTARQALDRVLAGSGLAASVDGASIVVREAPAHRSGETTLPTVTVTASGGLESAWGSVQGYVADAVRSATKTETPLLEVPQSVSVVTMERLDDMKPRSLQEAISYSPGVRINAFGFDPRYDSFTIRGIDVTYSGIFRDGLREPNSPNGVLRLEPYGLEAVSILRGPAGAVYGASSTGGIVDLITKRPTAKPFRELGLQSGSFDRLQGSFDFSGPVTSDGALLYRLTGLVRGAGTEIDAVKDDRFYIAPAFTLKPRDGTRLTILSEYMDSTTGGTAAFVNTYDGALTTGATKVFGGDARFNDFKQKQGRIGYEFEHRFSESVTLRQNVRYSKLATDQQYIFTGFPGLIQEDTAGLVADTHIQGRFATGNIQHKVLTGVDYSRLNWDANWAFGGFATVVPPTSLPFVQLQEQDQTMVGVYAQNQMAFGGWRLLLGGRHDWLDSTYKNDNYSGGIFTRHDQKKEATTGRVALNYIFETGLAPYIGYATSFTPNPGTVLGGSVAVPTTGKQVEVGIKYDVPGTNVALRAAAFDLEQQNAVVYQVVSGVNRQFQLDLTSRGIELEATASLASGLNVVAAYTYNDVEIDRLTAETEGKTLSSIPRHAATLWGGYTIRNGFAKGLGLGAGVRYTGSSFGDNLNRPVIHNDPRTFVDAMLSYELGELSPSLNGARLQVNASNLLDEVKQICTSNYCYWDEGRKIIASIRYRW